MRLLSTSTMNKRSADPTAYIAKSEGQYLKQIEKTVQSLAEQADEKPIILLSGPSGSGKTTTAFKLRESLCAKGIKTYALSMDNYFLTVDDPRNELEPDGSIDFESPKRLDFELIDNHLENLYTGEEFTLPIFDFANQRKLEGKRFRRYSHEMVILEGIHALNPAVTGRVSETAQGVYVSVRTRVKSKSGAELDPAKMRLMRRLVRDKLFRGRQAAQTLEFFEKVQIGQEKYIIPYKRYAEYNIDTFIAYEVAAYKDFLVKELADLRGTSGFTEYEDLMVILDEINSVEKEHIPSDSLVREFLGGSSFEY